MKWCFFINNFQILPEFFGKLSEEMIKRGDECLVVFASKIAEYDKKKFFSAGIKFISMIDWQANRHEADKEDFFGLSWKDFFPLFDRNSLLKKFDYTESIKITLQTVNFFEFIFEKEKPDVIISEAPSGLAHLVAYYFCQKNNAVYLGLDNSRVLSNRLDAFDRKFTCSKYEKTFEEINNGNILKEEKNLAEVFIKKFISHEQAPSYIEPAKIYFSQIGLIGHYLKRIKQTHSSLLQYIFSRQKYKLFDDESEITLKVFLRAPFNAERNKIRFLIQKKYFKVDPKKEKFFLFPLHYQPEAATDVYAIYYCDQLNAAKNIAFSLPFPYKLCVKEHPASAGARTTKFYEELKKIPNIVLISPHEKIVDIIKNSSGVVTLTGTAGLEAALSGKPVYVLGDVFYSYHPMCRKVNGFEELKKKKQNDLINVPDTTNLKDANIRFITSYLRNTVPGNTIMASVGKDTNDYKLIYQGLLKILSRI
jgi:hypothetical protein